MFCFTTHRIPLHGESIQITGMELYSETPVPIGHWDFVSGTAHLSAALLLSQGSCQALKQIDPWWAPPRESAHHSQMCQNPEVVSGLGRHSCSPVLYIQEPVGNVVRIRKNSHDLVPRAIFCSCSPRHFWLNAATHSTHTRSGSHLEFKSTHRFQQSKPGGSLSGYTKDINLHIC